MRHLYRDFLIFAVILRSTLLKCADISDLNDITDFDDIKDFIVASEPYFGVSSLFNSMKSLRILEAPKDQLIECELNEEDSQEIVEETYLDIMFQSESDDDVNDVNMPSHRSYDSLVDCTTCDEASMRASITSHQSRKYSMGSSISDLVRSRLDSICYEFHEEVTPTTDGNALESKISEDASFVSDLFAATVVSEVVSDNSDAEEESDCFEDRQVHRMNMKWIQSVLIPYFQGDNKLLTKTVEEILSLIKPMFANEPVINDFVIESDAKVIVVGDIHGQFEDLVAIFDQIGYPSHNLIYVFNGDIVDRGPKSIECLLTLFMLKICSPFSVYINRGNHESFTCGEGTFKNECFSFMREPLKFFNKCHEIFDVLPLGCIIQDKIFVCHGGLPAQFDLETFRNTRKHEFSASEGFIAMSLLWNDPHEGDGMILFNHRKNHGSDNLGPPHSFGADITREFLTKNDFSLLIRSHEFCRYGYFFSQNDKCLTVFSAPNYCGLGNKAAVIEIKSNADYQVIELLHPSILWRSDCGLRRDRCLTYNMDDPACFVITGSYK